MVREGEEDPRRGKRAVQIDGQSFFLFFFSLLVLPPDCPFPLSKDRDEQLTKGYSEP